MANRKENKFRLGEDKISFEIIKNQVNFIKNYHLSIDQSIKLIFNNSNNTNDEHIEFTSIFKSIDNAKSELNSMMKKLQPLEITINKNLKSKKINAFKNFIIRFFTFGKINRNKNIESEISKFKSDCQDIKKKIENIVKTLNDKTEEILVKIEEKHNLLKKENDKLKQENTKLRNENKIYKQQIEQFESNSQEDKKTIGELEQENQKMHEFINTDNKKFIGEYIILKNTIEGLKQEIEILKQNEEAAKTKELTDSGNESDSDTSNFNKDQINGTDSNEKKISTGILRFFKY